MQEIEVKILEINKEEIIAKLEKLWAKEVFEWKIENEFFENGENKRIRLRKMWGKNYITFKIKSENSIAKSNYELETEFLDYETMVGILENIWFNKYWNSNKKRISYHLWNIAFDFDDFPGIPSFVEIEATNNEDVIRWVELLWYTMKDTKTFWERELKKYYNII